MGPIARDRRRHVERLIKGTGLADHPQLSYDAKLLYVISGLRCNDTGHISKAALREATLDSYTRSVAMNILTKCGCPPVGGVLS